MIFSWGQNLGGGVFVHVCMAVSKGRVQGVHSQTHAQMMKMKNRDLVPHTKTLGTALNHVPPPSSIIDLVPLSHAKILDMSLKTHKKLRYGCIFV
jgi:hypothetical protein